jgi:hypothetical protein
MNSSSLTLNSIVNPAITKLDFRSQYALYEGVQFISKPVDTPLAANLELLIHILGLFKKDEPKCQYILTAHDFQLAINYLRLFEVREVVNENNTPKQITSGQLIKIADAQLAPKAYGLLLQQLRQQSWGKNTPLVDIHYRVLLMSLVTRKKFVADESQHPLYNEVEAFLEKHRGNQE